MQVEAWEIANNWCPDSFLVHCQPHASELPSAIHWQHPAAQPLQTLSPPFLNSPLRPPRHDEFCGFSTSFWRNMDLPLWSLLSTSVSVPFQKKQNTEQAWAKQLDNKNLQLKSTSIYKYLHISLSNQTLSKDLVVWYRRVYPLSKTGPLTTKSEGVLTQRRRNFQSNSCDSKRGQKLIGKVIPLNPSTDGWLQSVQARRVCVNRALSTFSWSGNTIASCRSWSSLLWKTERWDPTAAPLKV